MIDPANMIGGFVRAIPVAPEPSAAAVPASDVARLQLALADIPGGADAAGVAQDAVAITVGRPAAATPSGPAAPRTMGDAILQGLQSASTDITNAWRATGEVLNKPDITVSDMLRVQTMLLQSSVQYELVGKAVSKSTQSLENILKTQ